MELNKNSSKHTLSVTAKINNIRETVMCGDRSQSHAAQVCWVRAEVQLFVHKMATSNRQQGYLVLHLHVLYSHTVHV